MDRRVKYTRMVLNDSLIHFLEKKDITKITVKELCLDADVNRSTYYAHFTDPFDQIRQLKEEILHGVTDFAQSIEAQHLPAGEQQYRVLKAVLEYVESKRHIFRILLTRSGDRSLQQEILEILSAKAFPHDQNSLLSPQKREYLSIYASNGCFGMFYHWLMSDNPISPDTLAEMMAEFTRNVIL